ncbi:MAG: hypothetical protein R3F43_31300 [bacterium]
MTLATRKWWPAASAASSSTPSWLAVSVALVTEKPGLQATGHRVSVAACGLVGSGASPTSGRGGDGRASLRLQDASSGSKGVS